MKFWGSVCLRLVWLKNPKFSIIHDLTLAAGAEVRSGVNGDTDFAQAPVCRLGHVLFDVLSRVLYLWKIVWCAIIVWDVDTSRTQISAYFEFWLFRMSVEDLGILPKMAYISQTQFTLISW